MGTTTVERATVAPRRALLARLAADLQAARLLVRAGATLPSVALYPVRRRVPPRRAQIDLAGGVRLAAPHTEPLLFLFREVWMDHCYSPEPLVAPPASAIVDIGAHVGVFALWAATRHPDATVIALEPAPRAFAYLERNVLASRSRNVLAARLAVGRERATMPLYLVGQDMRNSLYPSAATPLSRSVPVEVVTLDDVFARFAVDDCALLKLDCEGAEYDILLGASAATLARVRNVALEYHVGLTPYGPADLAAHLGGHGFAVRFLPSRDDPVHGYLYARRESA